MPDIQVCRVGDIPPGFAARSARHYHHCNNSIMTEEFPEIEGGGSLILAWQVRNTKVLVVGGGEVSEWPYDVKSNQIK